MIQALIITMKEVLENEFTDEDERIWTLVMQNTVVTMMEEVKDMPNEFERINTNTEFDIMVV